MSDINDPAFPGDILPAKTIYAGEDEGGRRAYRDYPGMTKRELFAAMAMQGMLANAVATNLVVAASSVIMADALLAELAK